MNLGEREGGVTEMPREVPNHRGAWGSDPSLRMTDALECRVRRVN
jgi:hypothetical protein